MIPRYSRPEMARLWSDENRFATWLEVEIAATEVLVERGVVPAEALDAIKAQGPLRRRAHRGDRARGPARRDRLRLLRGRERRAGGALAALRAHLVRRGGHRARDPDARRLRPRAGRARSS